MSDKMRILGYQYRLQLAALNSEIQPAMQAHGGFPPERIAAEFTYETALAYLGVRKEGDTYVRN